MQSRIGRTLEATGSVVAEVDAGSPGAARGDRPRRARRDRAPGALRGSRRRSASSTTRPSSPGSAASLEHLRTQGAIDHRWLGPYITEDGSRYRIWGGRARDQGMPAFPTGRTAPAFPRVGPRLERTAEILLDAVTSPQSWYARWTARALGVPAGHGARLARALLERLNRTAC